MEEQLIAYLFETQALRVSPADAPFWYTSGLFGPYYINTHFLFGGEAAAAALLERIEALSAPAERPRFSAEIGRLCAQQYERNAIFRAVTDALAALVRGAEFDFVSGGARRDFFFSLQVARLLGKPHLAIFKDLSCYYAEGADAAGRAPGERDLAGKRALHVADLITEASSYTRAWIPALARCGARMETTLAVVDRCQGGVRILAEAGVAARCLIRIEPSLFDSAREQGLVDAEQAELLRSYYADPKGFVRRYLEARPDFLDRAARNDAKTAERAARLRALLDEGRV